MAARSASLTVKLALVVCTGTLGCKTAQTASTTASANPLAAAFGAEICDRLNEAAKKRGRLKLIELATLLQYMAERGDIAAAATLTELAQILKNPSAISKVESALQRIVAEAGLQESQLLVDGKIDEKVAKDIMEVWKSKNLSQTTQEMVASLKEEIAKDPTELARDVEDTKARAEQRFMDEITQPAGERMQGSPDRAFFELVISALNDKTTDPRLAEISKKACQGLASAIGADVASGAEATPENLGSSLATMDAKAQSQFRDALLTSAGVLMADRDGSIEKGEKILEYFAQSESRSVEEARATAVIRATELAIDPGTPESARPRLLLAATGVQFLAGGQPVEILSEASKAELLQLDKAYTDSMRVEGAGTMPDLAKVAERMKTIMEEAKRGAERLKERGREVIARPRGRI